VGVDEKWAAQATMLLNRVAKNRGRLVPWAERERITCYRLYDRDIPELPLVVDWYDGRLHISLYETPSAPESNQESQASYFGEKLAKYLDVEPKNVFVKFRRRAAGGTQYTPLDHQRHLIPVKEGGLTFLVNLSDYVDTGLFLDHRILRRMVTAEAKGKRFLNLFAYTGAFSVYAAAGGAATTTTVDLSNTYLEWAEKNMRQNGFFCAAHQFIRDDILGALEDGRMRGTYDLVIIDPPTISKSKSMPRSLDIERDHPVLLNGVLSRVSEGGTVFFSNNLKKFRLRADEIHCADITNITDKTRPFDFRSPFVHHSFRLLKRHCKV
jgi:23S rRNA G2069 N7-methylase RlmK/C1962 C5-methylase RlmI